MRILIAALIALFAIAPAAAGPGDGMSKDGGCYRTQARTS